jgi:outer membrane lipase/esterase
MKVQMDRTRHAALCVGLLASAMLASCGGGTQVERFVPTRVVAFGDESSLIDDFNADANGRKYTVNAIMADLVTLDCKANPIWVQYLATVYGLVFPQCNPDAVVAPTSRIYAAPDAKVADIAAQVDQSIAASPFAAKDLVTVLAGANDILAEYAKFPGVDADTLEKNVEADGAALATQVNRVADAGAKVLISTVPDMGLTPFAIAEQAANTDTDRAALLTSLTARFNAGLRTSIENDGRKIGLLLTDELVQAIVKSPSASGGFANVAAAACSAALPSCTTLTLVADPITALPASGDTWLWADDRHLSAGGQKGLGGLAATRAAGNPF